MQPQYIAGYAAQQAGSHEQNALTSWDKPENNKGQLNLTVEIVFAIKLCRRLVVNLFHAIDNEVIAEALACSAEVVKLDLLVLIRGADFGQEGRLFQGFKLSRFDLAGGQVAIAQRKPDAQEFSLSFVVDSLIGLLGHSLQRKEKKDQEKKGSAHGIIVSRCG